ncbi:thiol-disulfide oxidoreductase ResA [Mesobacillus harenae]|uniref:thiol-disulfide oxidoreductase ResA n=1 Tax=Mesobacillus harenae TaxID=2213203 RepID=UPI00157FBE7B|nr:thiol-disulfide oxidoreductase ResA [Mesobacillus harenae]
MKKRRTVIRTVILLVLGGAVAYTLYANLTKDNIQKVEIGKMAPDFVLVDREGEQQRLSDYRGEGVFLNFWATWCKPCEREFPYMETQYQRYKDQGVHVLAVNVSESDVAVDKFIERHNLTFPVVIDKDGQVQTAYGINPLPITFLVNPDGEVIKSHTGELTEDKIQEYMELIKP